MITKEDKQMVHDLQVFGVYITKGGKRINPMDFYIEDESKEEVREKKKHKNHKGRDDG